MKKQIIIMLFAAMVLCGCSSEKEEMILAPESTGNEEILSENNTAVSDDFVLPEPSEEYFQQNDSVSLNVAENGSEPDYLVNGEWMPDMSTWEECPYPEYNVKLDHGIWNESLKSDEDVEALYRDEVEPIVVSLLETLYNTKGDTKDYTEEIMQYCENTADVQFMRNFHKYYDPMEFSYEAYKNSVIYYFSNDTLVINGLAIIKSEAPLLQEYQRLHYIIPFALEFEKLDGEWKIYAAGGFYEFYYGDTVQTYTNDTYSAFVIMGHRLITFDFNSYSGEEEGENVP